MVNEYIRAISDASKQNKLTFFVGAGVSMLSEYPSWKALVNEFSKKLGLPIKGKDENYTNEEYLAIPQKFYYSINEDIKKYYELIEQHLEKEEIEPNDVHDLILMLKPASIVTTNFDNLIEKAVSKHGMFYDVIACDSSVGNLESKNYILKVHGDLKNRNIVLKEEDYLNYSEDFKLVETLLKSTFSTNTVVFIGYTLGDYNIKLILNWVRNLQGENFRTPYFIYTGNDELSDLDITYYKSRGLKIIDYKRFRNSTEEWFPRYSSVLEEILMFEEYNSKKVDFESTQSLHYLHQLMEPLNQLNVIRRDDIHEKLKGDYTLGDDGVIWKYSDEVNYIEEFNSLLLKARDKKIDDLNPEILSRYENISSTFEKANIYGYRSMYTRLDYGLSYGLEDSSSLYVDFNEMHEYIQKDYVDLDDLFKKAYYHFKLGEFDIAYGIYTSLSESYFKEKNYLKYYFSQINRCSAYKVLKALKRYTSSINGILTGNTKFDVDSWDKIEMVMSRMNQNEIYDSLPLIFRNNYPSLADLYSENHLYKSIYSMVEATNKSINSVKTHALEMGMTSIGKVIEKLNSHLFFVHGNYLMLDEYNEFKMIVKESLRAILFNYSSSFCEYIATNKFEEVQSRQKGIKLDKLDYTCLIQYFTNQELKKLLTECEIQKLDFIDVADNFEITKNLIEFYKGKKELFSNRYLHQKTMQYITNSIELLKYTDLNLEQYEYLINEMFNIDNRFFNIGDRVSFIRYQFRVNPLIKDSGNVVIESVLVKYLDAKHECVLSGKIFDEHSNNGSFYCDLASVIHRYFGDYESDIVDKKINELIDSNVVLSNVLMIQLTPILKDNTKNRILSLAMDELKNEFNFNVIRRLLGFELISDVNNLKTDIREFIELKQAELKELNEQPAIEPKFDERGEVKQEVWDRIEAKNKLNDSIIDTLESVGYWYSIGLIDASGFEVYKGISDEFDFFIDMEAFDYSKFDIKWLMRFNILETHTNIAKNSKAKEFIKNMLEENLRKDELDSKQKEWLLKIYLDVYNQ